MYAIIRTGGKQQKVREGDVLDVERIKEGEQATFTPLLVVGDDGSVISDKDLLSKASVTVEIVGEHRGNKIEGFTYKNKSGNRRRYGHRQTYSTIKVTKIDSGTKKAAKKSDTEKAEKKSDTEKAEKKSDTEKAEKKAAKKAETKKAETTKSETTKSETTKSETKAEAAGGADAKAAAEDSAAEEA